MLGSLPTVSRTPDINPGVRIPALCTENDVDVYIDAITSTKEELDNQCSDGVNRGSLTDRPLQDQMRALQSKLQGLKR